MSAGGRQDGKTGPGNLDGNRSYLGKILAHRLGRGTEIVTKGTGGAGLASALAEELARNMRCV